MTTVIDKIGALCANAIEAIVEQNAEDDARGAEPLDFGGNQDDAVAYGEGRGEVRGRGGLALQIIDILNGKDQE